MMSKAHNRLGIKLFFMLVIIIILAVVPLTFTAIRHFKQFGNSTAEMNEAQLRSLAETFLQEITIERSGRYQEFFNRIASSAALL